MYKLGEQHLSLTSPNPVGKNCSGCLGILRAFFRARTLDFFNQFKSGWCGLNEDDNAKRPKCRAEKGEPVQVGRPGVLFLGREEGVGTIRPRNYSGHQHFRGLRPDQHFAPSWSTNSLRHSAAKASRSRERNALDW